VIAEDILVAGVEIVALVQVMAGVAGRMKWSASCRLGRSKELQRYPFF
jgi:hypothetical protein